MIKFEKYIQKMGPLACRVIILAALMVYVNGYALADESYVHFSGLRTIMIDPGHGGYDVGGKGPDGCLEKDIALKLSEILADTLKPDYSAMLTRNGDYQVALTRRASAANQHRADLFISIHTGAGTRYQMDGWSVYYYGKADFNTDSEQRRTADRHYTDSLPSGWDQVCMRHQKNSRALGACIRAQLSNVPEIREVSLSGADLRVLQGLDMPAVLVETGYLTNPETEKHLNDQKFLADVARRIKKGIEVYLSR